MKNDDGIIRLGGVGTGRIFKHAHLRAYQEFFHKMWCVAFFDLDRQRAEQARDEYQERLEKLAEAKPDLAEKVKENISELTIHDSIESLLEQVDLVDICTHARGRMPTAISVFEADKSAMSEKPMARTWTEVNRAIYVKNKHPKAKFQLNDDNAFEPKYKMIHDVIASGEIGNIQHVSMIRGSHLGGTTVLQAQATGMENGGGCLMDYGTHGLAGVSTIFGPSYAPRKVEAVQIATLHRHRILENQPFIMEVDDNARVKVMMENTETGSWATVFIEATWCGGHTSLYENKSGSQSGGVLEIIGDKGVITTAESDKFTIKYHTGGVMEIPVLEFEGETISIQDEINTFFDAYLQGNDGKLTLEFGARVIALCGAAYLSQLQGGTAVTLDDFYAYSKEFVDKYGDNVKADDAIVASLLEPYKRRE